MNTKIEFAALTGSQKQISWAEDLREGAVKCIRAYIAQCEEKLARYRLNLEAGKMTQERFDEWAERINGNIREGENSIVALAAETDASYIIDLCKDRVPGKNWKWNAWDDIQCIENIGYGLTDSIQLEQRIRARRNRCRQSMG